MWGANSATLVHGSRDAVLVDAFFTLDHLAKVADETTTSAQTC